MYFRVPYDETDPQDPDPVGTFLDKLGSDMPPIQDDFYDEEENDDDED